MRATDRALLHQDFAEQRAAALVLLDRAIELLARDRGRAQQDDPEPPADQLRKLVRPAAAQIVLQRKHCVQFQRVEHAHLNQQTAEPAVVLALLFDRRVEFDMPEQARADEQLAEAGGGNGWVDGHGYLWFWLARRTGLEHHHAFNVNGLKSVWRS